MWKYVDIWDGLAVVLLLFSIWMVLSAIPKMKVLSEEKVNTKQLYWTALSGVVLSAAYLVIHVYMVMHN